MPGRDARILRQIRREPVGQPDKVERLDTSVQQGISRSRIVPRHRLGDDLQTIDAGVAHDRGIIPVAAEPALEDDGLAIACSENQALANATEVQIFVRDAASQRQGVEASIGITAPRINPVVPVTAVEQDDVAAVVTPDVVVTTTADQQVVGDRCLQIIAPLAARQQVVGAVILPAGDELVRTASSGQYIGVYACNDQIVARARQNRIVAGGTGKLVVSVRRHERNAGHDVRHSPCRSIRKHDLLDLVGIRQQPGIKGQAVCSSDNGQHHGTPQVGHDNIVWRDIRREMHGVDVPRCRVAIPDAHIAVAAPEQERVVADIT